MSAKKKHKKSVVKNSLLPTISQEMLAKYRYLQDLIKQKEELRQKILDLLDLGAKVEPGSYMVEVKECVQVRASWQNLKKLLGKQDIHWLRDSIAPTTSRHLIVTGNEWIDEMAGL